MDKKWIICIIITCIVGLILGVTLAFWLEGRNNPKANEGLSEKKLAETNNVENIFENDINTIETSSAENNISPNAIIIKKTYYKSCDHLIRKVEEIPEELVNKTEADIKEQYKDWEVESYSPTQIVLYKSQNGNCGEHYFVQEHNGVIGIYTTDENGVKKLEKDTEILTQYLPEADLQQLKAGVEIIGYTNLIEFLEDYE